MFSKSIDFALQAIAQYDDYQWAKFSFYPCPVGASTPLGCLSDPCPPKEPGCVKKDFVECCIKDKYEDCIVSHLGCTDESPCTMDTRAKLAKFLGCFEGGHISENHCPQDPKNCTVYAGLGAEYEAINHCFSNATQVTAAGKPIDATCAAENIDFWPHVKVNGVKAGGPNCDQDSCVIPILPVLCRAYSGAAKPKTCQMLAAGTLSAR